MRKKDDFDIDDEPSIAGTIVVIIITLVIVAVVMVGAYFFLFRGDDAETEATVTPIPTEVVTPIPTQAPTPEATQAPTPEPTQELTPEPTEEATQAPAPEPTQEPTPVLTPEPEDNDGIKTVFTDCDEMVTPKEAVNLRTLPSITHPDSVVVVKLEHGYSVRRTGINTDVGWSRVEYGGQVLYCISSYVFVVE